MTNLRENVLAALQNTAEEFREETPSHSEFVTVRGLVVYPVDTSEEIEAAEQALHDAGERCVRVHGERSIDCSSSHWLYAQDHKGA